MVRKGAQEAAGSGHRSPGTSGARRSGEEAQREGGRFIYDTSGTGAGQREGLSPHRTIHGPSRRARTLGRARQTRQPLPIIVAQPPMAEAIDGPPKIPNEWPRGRGTRGVKKWGGRGRRAREQGRPVKFTGRPRPAPEADKPLSVTYNPLSAPAPRAKSNSQGAARHTGGFCHKGLLWPLYFNPGIRGLFKNARICRKRSKIAGRPACSLETDAPFLAPVPHRENGETGILLLIERPLFRRVLRGEE